MPAGDEEQRQVDEYFDPLARHWRELYEEATLEGTIHRERQSLALKWIDELALPAGATVLEVGCGAGLTAVELARRGFRVEAIDSSDAMVDLARQHAAEAGVGDRVVLTRGDAHTLPFDADSFSLVVALGVLPFLHSPEQALRETARVLRPGGHVLLTSDNRARLNRLLDPRFNPLLAPLKRLLREVLRRAGGRPPKPTVADALSGSAHLYLLREVERMLWAAGITLVKAASIGFGPFSFLGFALLPDRAAIPVHRFLQALAVRNVPLLRSLGLQHAILARKESGGPLPRVRS